MRSKELPVELRDKIMSRNRSGEEYKNNSADLKITRTQWPPSYLNLRCLETPRLFLELTV
jgi:hypothetical protein